MRRWLAALVLAGSLVGAGGAPAAHAQSPAPPTDGYVLVTASGAALPYGSAGASGAPLGSRLARPIVGGASGGAHAWMVASDGGIFALAGSPFLGSMGGVVLNRPIVGMAATPSGEGYWLVASDGGIFSFGDAVFRGSTGGVVLNRPIVGMAATPSGDGYWLVASDGGIFTFGDAPFAGSAGGAPLRRPIVAMAAAEGGGYRLVASDGGVFAFGGATFLGSAGGSGLGNVVGILSRVDRHTYFGSSTGSPLTPQEQQAMTGVSWRAGCPVPLNALRHVSVAYVGLDGIDHAGDIVVNAAAVPAVDTAFRALYGAGFRVERVARIEEFGGDDETAMKADATTAFNCRFVQGTSSFSAHASGLAIDLNPLRNPAISADGSVDPPEGAAFLPRDPSVPGVITAFSAPTAIFADLGWGWGGAFRRPDYQHFSATGH